MKLLVTLPAVHDAQLHKLLTMFLFGMLNWMFTWFRPEGRFTYEEMVPIATQLFVNGISGLEIETRKTTRGKGGASVAPRTRVVRRAQ